MVNPRSAEVGFFFSSLDDEGAVRPAKNSKIAWRSLWSINKEISALSKIPNSPLATIAARWFEKEKA